MGKTSYKGLRVDYQPGQKVKVMLGNDWFDAEVVKANRKTVVVVTLFSKTKYRRVPGEEGGLTKTLEPYTVSGTRTVKLPRVRVKPLESGPGREELASRHLQQYESGEEPEMAKDVSVSEPEYEGPGLGKDEAPLIDEAKAKPKTAADVLAELEKLIG